MGTIQFNSVLESIFLDILPKSIFKIFFASGGYVFRWAGTATFTTF
jgi:hypothetical protein